VKKDCFATTPTIELRSTATGALHQTNGEFKIAQEKTQRVNGQITVPTVRLIDANGSQVGIVTITEALRQAEADDLDLVEIVPGERPPVCRIMNYGKFKYAESKKQSKQKAPPLKEIQLRPVTGEGDYQVKLKSMLKFLNEGSKVKVSMRFKGREISHQEIGLAMLERLKGDVGDHGSVEQHPRLEGRQAIMTVIPPRKK